jgi:hypothetical protein
LDVLSNPGISRYFLPFSVADNLMLQKICRKPAFLFMALTLVRKEGHLKIKMFAFENQA